ncbi:MULTISPECIES: M23 family metallopeptidase [unclassified Chryseobacterium]|uniref:M23 family metallopeptidase n=1 Tax=unclassified Chryseobacterium TaxID=2593645 RepID=UPI0028532D94|nr:M23 family metallopeptidase [Chryseobacterium sp. CFS7]MDR4894341.1 M23 family metallopeptidase [Chryseobacterium sp. CFS7]
MIPPVESYSKIVSSNFGYRKHPIDGVVKKHQGVDFSVPQGTAVFSTYYGIVLSSMYERGYGNTILIDNEGGFRTRYGHLMALFVGKGEFVKPGQLIGLSGNTGHSTGPHLHYEIIVEGKKIDPLLFLNIMCKNSL